MRTVSNAIIYNNEWWILVVDKHKNDWRVLTILPWWKNDIWESSIDTLKREILEELWIEIDWFKRKICTIVWESPTSKIETECELIEVTLSSHQFNCKNEVENPRFLTSKEIQELETVTELTKKCIQSI